MRNKKSQIIKTDAFFVENKNDKKMYLQNKSEFIFDKISVSIEKQKKFEEHNKIGTRSAKSSKELRIAKRSYNYKFELINGVFHYAKVNKDDIPNNINLSKNEFAINENSVGYFKGTEFNLIHLLDRLEKENKH